MIEIDADSEEIELSYNARKYIIEYMKMCRLVKELKSDKTSPNDKKTLAKEIPKIDKELPVLFKKIPNDELPLVINRIKKLGGCKDVQ